MTLEMITALMGFALATSITPGPNNLMLLASGANFGLRRTVPHMLGISLGHGFMMIMVGLGLAAIFEAYPLLRRAMMVASLLYLAWLAWKVANAAPPGEAQIEGKPLTFLQAAGFQWVNPKGWYMALTAIAAYTPPEAGALGAVMVAAIFSATNLPAILVWAGFGTQVRRLLRKPGHLRLFNRTMAVLLLLTTIPIVRGLV
ncbi:LysE family translocator [Ponticoccus sp. SC2-23]|uniref:LysE family translocator n=1 Tax=Alexandriicola marinus TaxID=2081710 RepID=UPI000FD78EE5|nr:LysE family translocator [Alexandriicola marinus]MBM1219505.1 LysE family translocator [Ponticoccus sp. SC6-9]MBM1223423.1 LysE family translocator [Ponticoccus sp. SC6-15]MBM1229318.1 LysE family translocator [Ponticoccus sp. SC6-38]MBM1232389.1 LysE family translocator [Ponticoccus sp. SC6-45]MBM1237661.1 LysE family translocator [Ponticoccus sp. SC6-49]MBM1241400.1 LysE family translocator [Ponticoccus sp. SC2-64]MBM1245913.1 LysE family translocator [Ponticoccus sp. SC6-42]MBM1250391